MDNLHAHPIAELFPLLEGDDYEEFKRSIADQGQLQPIELYQGQILDGRNRYRACQDLGIEPTFKEYRGDDPIAHIWALNVTRRQMTVGQKAAIAVEMLPLLKEEAKRRQQAHGGTAPGRSKDEALRINRPGVLPDDNPRRARDDAAALTGVGAATITRAARVKEANPKLYEKVRSGEISVNAAYERVVMDGSAGVTRTKESTPSERAYSGASLVAQVAKLLTKLKDRELEEVREFIISRGWTK